MHARKRDPSTLQLQHGTNENGPIIKELHERQKIWAMRSRSNKLELAMHSVIKTEGGPWLYNSSHNLSHAFSLWPCIQSQHHAATRQWTKEGGPISKESCEAKCMRHAFT
ncbi:hypothetical protein NC651_002021 [Populus alba x Populus x berolinensis]|nr:hypothetical protein NC651_002021 [Populus alba x Populus x berolinensis]